MKMFRAFALVSLLGILAHPVVTVNGKVSAKGLVGLNLAPGVSPISLSISPLNQTTTTGSTIGYTAILTLSDLATINVSQYSNWATANATIAALNSLTATQNVLCSSAGATTISASYGPFTAATSLTCTAVVPPAPTLSSIAVTPASPSSPVGQATAMTAIGTYSDGSTQDLTTAVTWSSGTPSHATIGAAGNPQPVNCVASGTSVITATDPATSIAGNTTITCNAVLTSIAVTPASPSILVGGTQTFIATGTYSDGSKQDVTSQATWTSGTPANAVIGAAANPQPVNGLAAGTSVITATVGSVSGNTTLTITNPGPPPPTLSSIVVSPTSPTINVGQSLAFIATCVYSDGSTQNCSASATWASSNTSVATLQLPDGVVGSPYSKTLTGTGSLPYLWSVPSGPSSGAVDMLDWWLLIDRSNFHMSGTGSRYSALNAGLASGIKSSSGNPQDGRWYDKNFLYFGVTDDGDSADQAACQLAGYPSCFADPFSYKLALNVRPFSPRYFVLGGPDVTIVNPSPNMGVSTTNCGVDNHAPRDLGNVVTVTHDAGASTNWGGDVGSARTITVSYYRGLTSTTPPYQSGSLETYYMASPFGVFKYQSADWNGSSYGTITIDTLNNNKVAGGAPTMNFGCGFPVFPLTGGLPPGIAAATAPQMNLDQTGAISGTPTTAGTYPVTIQQEDSGGAFHLQNQVIRVAANPAAAQQTVNGIANGTSVISATIGAVSGNQTLTVQTPAPTLSSVAVTPPTPTVFVGQSIGLTATGTYSDSSTKNLTNAPGTTWTSGTPANVTIGSAGNPQLVNCIAAGTSVITATNTAISGNTTVTCTNPTPPSVAFDTYCPSGTPTWGASDDTASLPLTCDNTNPSNRPTGGTVRAVTSATWNTVMAATNCDDVIEPAPGAILTGTFTVTSKVCPPGHFRTIRVQNFNSTFPAYGLTAGVGGGISPCLWGTATLPGYVKRDGVTPLWGSCTPSNVGATIQSTNQAQAMILQGPISGLQIEGLHIMRNSSSFFSDVITKTGTGFDRIILDRNWCSSTTAGTTNRCFDSSSVSHFDAIGNFAVDFMCLNGGPGGLCSSDAHPFGDGRNNTGVQDCTKKIVGNFFTATAQGYFSGGGGANIVPCDFEIRLNYFFKPMCWNPTSTCYTYTNVPSVKNLLEFKNGNRILIEGNVFRNTWVAVDQNGSAIVITPKNQAGAGGAGQCPVCATTNITVRYNYITKANYPFQVSNNSTAAGFATAGNNFSFHDNVADSLGYTSAELGATCYQCGGNSGNALDGGFYENPSVTASDVQKHGHFLHNTLVRGPGAPNKAGMLGISGAKAGSGKQMDDYFWKNNFAPNQRGGSTGVSNPLDQCAAGLNCNCGMTSPKASLDACFVTYQLAGNCIVNDQGTVWPGTNVTSGTSESTELVNYNNGIMLPGGDFHIASNSACHNQATDGKDPGADINTLLNRIQTINVF